MPRGSNWSPPTGGAEPSAGFFLAEPVAVESSRTMMVPTSAAPAGSREYRMHGSAEITVSLTVPVCTVAVDGYAPEGVLFSSGSRL